MAVFRRVRHVFFFFFGRKWHCTDNIIVFVRFVCTLVSLLFQAQATLKLLELWWPELRAWPCKTWPTSVWRAYLATLGPAIEASTVAVTTYNNQDGVLWTQHWLDCYQLPIKTVSLRYIYVLWIDRILRVVPRFFKFLNYLLCNQIFDCIFSKIENVNIIYILRIKYNCGDVNNICLIIKLYVPHFDLERLIYVIVHFYE